MKKHILSNYQLNKRDEVNDINFTQLIFENNKLLRKTDSTIETRNVENSDHEKEVIL